MSMNIFRMCLLASLAAPLACLAQTAARSASLTIDGYTGQVPITQVNGRSYVDLEALARVTNSSIRLQGNRLILTLPAQSAAAPAAAATPRASTGTESPAGFSRDYVTANVAAISALREWRATLLYAVQNNQPVTNELTSSYRRSAESQVALAAAATQNSQDKNAATLLQNELGNMRTLNATFVSAHDSATNIRTDAMDTDPTSLKVLSCMAALNGIVVGGQFQDVTTCH